MKWKAFSKLRYIEGLLLGLTLGLGVSLVVLFVHQGVDVTLTSLIPYVEALAVLVGIVIAAWGIRKQIEHQIERDEERREIQRKAHLLRAIRSWNFLISKSDEMIEWVIIGAGPPPVRRADFDDFFSVMGDVALSLENEELQIFVAALALLEENLSALAHQRSSRSDLENEYEADAPLPTEVDMYPERIEDMNMFFFFHAVDWCKLRAISRRFIQAAKNSAEATDIGTTDELLISVMEPRSKPQVGEFISVWAGVPAEEKLNEVIRRLPSDELSIKQTDYSQFPT